MIDAFTIPQVYASQTMHDNPKAAPAHEFRLQTHTVLAICGRDAIAFAQAQFMNDVAAIAPGQWQWNGWLTAKGRVVALFALLKLDAETLWLLLPDIAADTFAEQLRRYVFRSKLTLMPRADLHVAGSFSPPAQACGNTYSSSEDGIHLDLSATAGPRTLRIVSVAAADDASALARWNAADLAHGLPRLPPTQTEQWTPQQLSLERLAAFSVKKGCYPGQEIIARAQYRGQVKRGLALYDSPQMLGAGDKLIAHDKEVGTVINAVPQAGGFLLLAVVRFDAAAEPGLHTEQGAPLRLKRRWFESEEEAGAAV